MDECLCYRFYENSAITYYRNKTIDHNKIIRLMTFNILQKPIIWHNPYKICGVLMTLIIELSAKYGYSLSRMKNTDTFGEVIQLINHNKLELWLFPVRQMYAQLHRSNNYEPTLTKTIGEKSGDHIISILKSEQWPTFTFMGSFQPNVWLWLVFSIVLNSIVTSFTNKNLCTFVSHAWKFCSILLSEPFPPKSFRKLTKRLPQQIVIIIWLMSCTVLLSSFSGALLGFFMRNAPNDVIDSFDQLIDRKELQIITPYGHYFESFVSRMKYTDPLAKHFSNRLVIKSQIPLSSLTHPTLIDLLDKLKTGKYVLVIGKTQLDSNLLYSRNKFGNELKRIVYVSKYGWGDTFYYSLLVSPSHIQLQCDLNVLIGSFTESGIYSYWILRAKINANTVDSQRKWLDNYSESVLNLIRLKGVFYLWFIGETVSVIIFTIETYFSRHW